MLGAGLASCPSNARDPALLPPGVVAVDAREPGRSQRWSHDVRHRRPAAPGEPPIDRDPPSACAPRSSTAAPTRAASTATTASGSASSGCGSSTSPPATSRSTTRTARSSSCSTARSTTTASCASELRGARAPLRHATATPRSSSTSTRSTARDCVEHLHGMFALRALGRGAGDGCCSRATASARSRCSTPCATARSSFASELAALLQDPDDPARRRPRARSTPTSPTATSRRRSARFAARAQAAARPHARAATTARASVERYWQLDYAPQARAHRPRSWTSEIRDAVCAATAPRHGRRRAARRVPVGRGRLVGRRRGDGRRVARSRCGRSRSASTTQRFDELPHARRVAERFGTEHHEFDGRARRDRDAVPQHRPPLRRAVRRLLRDPELLPGRDDARAHVTVALNGDGGDESFAGYTRYVANALGGPVRAARRDRCAAACGRARCAHPTRRRGRRACATGAAVSCRVWRSTRRAATRDIMAWFDTSQRAAIYTPEFGRRAAAMRPPAPGAWRARGRRPRVSDVVDRMLEVDVSTYLRG